MELEKFQYDNEIPKQFAVATIFWGVVGMLIGVIAAFQLAYPGLNLGIEYTTFGRLRPVHTNAVIFAFVGNGIFTAVYYSMPRLLKTEMWSKALGKIHFWGWQLIIVAAAITLLMGYTTAKEYAELEWPLDIAITLIWVVFGINMFGTILTRRERHLYVAIWFFIASWVTVAMLHIVNSVELPVSLFKSYSWYAGVQDALVQWWYGHNAVAFFLTTPYLGLMYYFLPKAAGRPIYSYRLSIVHFWSLIFLYIWAGPHHLLYTALPEWAQSLGTVFSIMLLLPSWGGMLNGLFTLRGAWDKVRVDPILKFFVVAVTCYGMSTFEGPMLSLKNVNAISHYSDWTVAHVHIGALGWNGFLTFGMLYWLFPRLFNTKLYSVKLASTHFWIATVGIVLYAIPLYWAAFRTYFMMSAFTPEGQLQYQFIEVIQSIIPFYVLRALGGTIYLAGTILMVYNLYKTAKSGSFVKSEAMEAPALEKKYVKPANTHWHSWVERRPITLLVLSLIVVGIGGLVEMVPTFLVKSNVPTISSVKPYTPLELQGRDIYIKEGCYNCHSQMIRPFRYEVSRYGDYSKAGEFVYDHPYQWGSKRTGPDLARIGGKYPDSWHFNHMLEPESMAPGSIMPPYPWLFEKSVDAGTTMSKIHAMRKLGVPYPEGYESKANADMKKQAEKIAENLKKDKLTISPDKEIIALIAYLQRLGTDAKTINNAE
ncbi:MAG: cytochrome-c oxidase, cbb3-type subunit I [Saprospiraceae bacterium]|jgi:cytochrome c oxidase cbb3-type subunit I/II|nr:MAG: bifunctional cbb3-type cytochrome C oxidase subunit I/II [Candidatus Parvibacillus calidus]MBX2936036.1 cytochrome-c oxidase, cbb3-type subunit I [Saprospiraceae bacterium]MBX7179603.1 cytochrome-c oxidase, cbb3-type subunit I [Saprospiraceae bacterium]MCB0590156.1 cytochrome-c oxidase, cbb3-type subunit I [Saprospiraceae bacterium]MCO5283467.1 cytochrome-c oxidase, cbb3-type subunit I [Saprospiraceae bacterium]